MTTQQNIADLQQKFMIKLTPEIQKRVSKDDRKMLADAYMKLFAGFTWVNWTNKHSLGRAWQTALGQCDSFIKTKNDKNLAAQYLKNVFSAHKPYWSQVIMTHKNRDKAINPNQNEAKQIREHGINMIRTAMDTINIILAQYNDRAEQMVAMQQQKTDTRYSAQPAVQPQAKSGAFPTLRDTKKQSEIPVMTADKEKSVLPVPEKSPQQTMQPEQMAALQKQQQQIPQPQLNPAVQPQLAQASQQKPDVQYAPRPAVQPQAKSGAFPTLRDTKKQSEIPVMTTDKEKSALSIPQKKASLAQAEQKVIAQHAQLQIKMQKRMQMWIIGQQFQNAA